MHLSVAHIDNAMQYGGKQVFSVQSGQQMLKLDHYASMVSRLCALQKVDLNLLDSDQKRICFFANLLNLMTIHYNLHCILHGTDVSSAQHGVRSKLIICFECFQGLECSDFFIAKIIVVF